jgi:hypothetical protein
MWRGAADGVGAALVPISQVEAQSEVLAGPELENLPEIRGSLEGDGHGVLGDSLNVRHF